jgi:hypothetical protein
MGGVRRWTKDDINKLILMAQKYPTAQIAAELGRGRSATALKAHELKLSLRMRHKRKGIDEQTCPEPGAVGLDLRD